MKAKGDYFEKVDKLYQDSNFSEDDKVLELLNEHLSIERDLSLKNTNAIQQFHTINVETINFLISNINNSCYKSDAIIYLYSYMIYRYMANITANPNTFLKTAEKYRELFANWLSVYNTTNINNVSTDLFKVFPSYLIGNSQEIVDFLVRDTNNNRNIDYIYMFCRTLLYDRNFCFSQFLYNTEMHYGSYILFDILTFNISYKQTGIKEKWIDAFINFFEKNKEITVGSICNYYLTYSKLYKCIYFSNEYEEEIRSIFDSIELPEFEINDFCNQLYLLYSFKFIYLTNIKNYDRVLDQCNYLLGILERPDKESLRFIKEGINWRKNYALKQLDSEKHIDWFFKLIHDNEVEQIGNYIYFSPFIKNEVDDEITLYHFTDINALKSIIDNKKLWLTRYDFLNDTEEIKYIVEIIKNNISNIHEKEIQIFINDCLEILGFYFNEDPKNPPDEEKVKIIDSIKDNLSNIYILSNSTKDDNLSLWHYYSGGTGCSLKISKDDFIKQSEYLNISISKKDSHLFMRTINYIDDSYPKELFDLIQTIFKNDLLSVEQKKYLVCVHFVYEGIFSKNKNMSQEQEFRIAVILNKDCRYTYGQLITQYRTGKNTIIPYIAINIEPSSLIKEICIAPLNKTDNAKKGFQEYLKSKNFKNYKEMVKVSNIKLRY